MLWTLCPTLVDRRNEITRYLENAWRRAGGEPLSEEGWGSAAELKAWEHKVKKALRMLRAQGRVREATVNGVRVHGVWEWVGEQDPMSGAVASDQAEANVGSGKSLVYGLYDKRDKDAALAGGEDRWRVKVGKTRGRSPFDRIQDGAFLPDRLSWGLAIWTDDPDSDEKLVKGMLERRGRRYSGTGGTEWFVTSPDEIEEIYRSIVAG